jgi:glucokinase
LRAHDADLKRIVLALDIGGTKMAAGVVDGDGHIRGRGRVPVPSTTNPDDLFEALRTCADRALQDAGVLRSKVAGVGCGSVGPMEWPAGKVSPLNLPAWRGFPLRDRLHEEFGRVPVLVHNDAIALAVGEHWRGEGVGTANMLALTVSTGVGGGLILDNRIYHGTSGNAGHIGHIIVEPNGPECPCGGNGCLEAIASGPSAVRLAQAEGWRPPEGVSLDGRALAEAAAAGNEIATRSLERAGQAVGVALASCASALDLQVAVVTGGFSQSGPSFWKALEAAFDQHARMAFTRRMQILPSTLFGEAGLLGAAAFVLVPGSYGW